MGMTAPDQLKRLIERAITDPREEKAFMQALLTAQLYVHLPLSDDSPKLRMICFTRPDGLTVIPVFSDVEKAVAAAQGAARVVAMTGQELFSIVPGPTFMIDPNDRSTTLYPEEIAARLQRGDAAIVPTSISNAALELSPADPEDRWLGDRIVQAVCAIDSVAAVHLAQAHLAGSIDPTVLLAVVAVPDVWAERVARAIALTLQNSARPPRLGVDVCTYDPADPPAWVGEPGLEPVWTRVP